MNPRAGLVGWHQMGVRERLFATLIVLRGAAERGVRPRDLMYSQNGDDVRYVDGGSLQAVWPVTSELDESLRAIRILAPTKYANLADLMEEIESDD